MTYNWSGDLGNHRCIWRDLTATVDRTGAHEWTARVTDPTGNDVPTLEGVSIHTREAGKRVCEMAMRLWYIDNEVKPLVEAME